MTLAGKTYVFRPAAASAASAGETSLQSPMPAKVVEVLVKVGDQVEAQQSLIRLEAMNLLWEMASANHSQHAPPCRKIPEKPWMRQAEPRGGGGIKGGI